MRVRQVKTENGESVERNGTTGDRHFMSLQKYAGVGGFLHASWLPGLIVILQDLEREEVLVSSASVLSLRFCCW